MGRRPDSPATWSLYTIDGGLLVLGVVLWAPTWMANRGLPAKKTYFRDPDDLGGDGPVDKPAEALRQARRAKGSRRGWHRPCA